jgi:NAD(P)H-hydrate epimerase
MKITSIRVNDLKKLIPKRKTTANKGDGGKAYIFAGSKGMWGAGLLCAQAAARSGAGYTYLVSLKVEGKNGAGFLKALSKHPDFLQMELNIRGIVSKLTCQKTSAAIGPGCGSSQASRKKIIKVLLALKKSAAEAVVVDADGLNALATISKNNFKSFFPLPSTWILTPHEMELARLLKWPVSKIKKAREKAITEAQKKFGCWVILKGAHTLIKGPGTSILKVMTGNSALAKGGTGDVLTGILAALRAQGLNSKEAAILAVGLHGYLADLWVKGKRDKLSLLASDLIDLLPLGLRRLRGE